MPARGVASRPALLAAALTALAPVSGPACAAPAAPATDIRRFDIPAGPLDRALAAFALQAGVSIGGADLPPRSSRGVRGAMRPQDALDRLLRGTGLGAVFVDSRTVRIDRIAAAAQPPRAAPLAPAAPADEIVVTATRRSGPVSAVPISAAALTAADLFAIGAATSEAALRAVAGVVTTNLGSGRDKIFVRGLSDGAFTGRTETTVSVYLDDARATYSAPDPDLRLVDVARVEVLRGPQSLLYGAGSLGGIYRVVTNAPTADGWAAGGGATLALTRSGDPSWRGEGVLNAPLARDRAALRLVAYRSRDGGYIDDPVRGANRNVTNVVGGRAALRWQGGGWTVDLAGALQDIEARDSQYADPRIGALARRTAVAEPHDNDFRLGRLTVAGELGAVRLDSTTSLVRHEVDSRYDAGAALPALAGRPVATATFDERERIQLFGHETRLRPLAGDRWLMGVSLLHGDTRYSGALNPVGAAAPAYRQRRADDVLEAALFGQAEAPLTPSLSAAAGARLVATRLTSDATREDAESDRRATRTRLLPTASLSWRPADGSLMYLSVTTGDRAGGLNASAAGGGADRFESDKLLSGELGAKLGLFDDALEVDAAAFAVRWSDIQTDQLLPSGLLFTTNAGDGRNIGVEASLTLRPADGWRLRFNGLLNDPELADPEPGFRGGTESPLPSVPNRLASAEVGYSRDLGQFELNVGASARYVGPSRLLLSGASTTRQGGYTTLDTHVALARGRYAVRLFVDNLLDSRANTFAFGNPFTFATASQRTPPRPRTIGVSMTIVSD